jgi:hypothetical protein
MARVADEAISHDVSLQAVHVFAAGGSVTGTPRRRRGAARRSVTGLYGVKILCRCGSPIRCAVRLLGGTR